MAHVAVTAFPTKNLPTVLSEVAEEAATVEAMAATQVLQAAEAAEDMAPVEMGQPERVPEQPYLLTPVAELMEVAEAEAV